MQYEQHPLSSAFPCMSDDDYEALRDSIESIGVQNPITLYEGMVLDGWHRYQAACELVMDCPSAELSAWLDPRDFVLAQNKTRRHITAMQLAISATEVYAWRSAGNPVKPAGPAALTKTVKELAEIAGVSERSIRQAKSVHTHAAPEVLQAVKQGYIGGEKATAIAKLPQAEQAAAINKPLPKPTKPVQAEEPTEPPDYTELDAARDQIAELQSALVVSRMDGTDEDKQQASALIADLRAEVTKLTAVLKATELSRDSLIEERAQMLRQLKAQRSELTRLKAA
jgi:type IV secretory pathway VirB10-like protein